MLDLLIPDLYWWEWCFIALIGSGSITVLVAKLLAVGHSLDEDQDEHEENSI